MGVSEIKLWLSKQLSDDLTLISKYNCSPEREWVMRAVLSAVREEKERVVSRIEKEFINGFLDVSDFRELLGKSPNADLMEKRAELSILESDNALFVKRNSESKS